jgi:hypothetical protein
MASASSPASARVSMFSSVDRLTKLQRLDTYLLLILLCLVALFFSRKGLTLSGIPFEDAAILLHYSANLAAGHGIVWNSARRRLMVQPIFSQW